MENLSFHVNRFATLLPCLPRVFDLFAPSPVTDERAPFHFPWALCLEKLQEFFIHQKYMLPPVSLDVKMR